MADLADSLLRQGGSLPHEARRRQSEARVGAFGGARLAAEKRYPYLKKFRDVPIARSLIPHKGGWGEFMEPDSPSNPLPGNWTISVDRSAADRPGGVENVIVADMVHAASTLDPEFQGLKRELRENLSPMEVEFARKRYETQFKGQQSGSNFATFDNFMDTYWTDGMVQHLLLPEGSEIDEIMKGSPDAAPTFGKIKALFEGKSGG